MYALYSETCIETWQSKALQLHFHGIHEDRKEYQCDTCEKTFSRQHELNRHIITVHEGKRDYKCESCGKTFSFNQSLKKHVYTVHEGPHCRLVV